MTLEPPTVTQAIGGPLRHANGKHGVALSKEARPDAETIDLEISRLANLVTLEWPSRARRAIQPAERTGRDNQSVCELLLADIRAIFTERGVDRLPSAKLVEALVAIEGRPWSEWKLGKPISANGVARLLARFGINTETIRVSDRTPKGYQRARFDDAFLRYLPPNGS
jgi:hypothetical protein